MRRLLTASLLGLTLVLAACGGSDEPSSEETGAGQPATGGDTASTSTTAAKQDGPGCRALKGYLNAEIIAYKKLEQGEVTPESKAQLLTGIDNTSAKLKETLPPMTEITDARVLVVKAELDGVPPSPEQQAAADAALKNMNNYKATNCAPPPEGSAKNLPGAGDAASTTTSVAE